MMLSSFLSLMLALVSASLVACNETGSKPQEIVSQPLAPLHLQVVSNRDPGDFRQPYRYDASAGDGIFVYVLDSPVNGAHPEFKEGQVQQLRMPIDNFCGLGPEPHGTQVASMIVGQSVGVARDATIVSVTVGSQITDECNSWRYVRVAMRAALADIVYGGRVNNSVVHMSLGFDSYTTDNPFVCSIINLWMGAFARHGIPVVTSAGNEYIDASEVCPGNATNAINVGSIDPWWWRSPYSNYGESVHILAPGGHVDLANGTEGLVEVSGTSFSAPMVSGMVAYLLAKYGYVDPRTMRDQLQEMATKGKIWDVRGSPNLLLYNGEGF